MTLLRGNMVRLRPFEPDDMKDIFRWVNNPEAVGEFDVFRVTSWSEVEKWFKEHGPHEFSTLIIEKNEDGSKNPVIFGQDYGLIFKAKNDKTCLKRLASLIKVCGFLMQTKVYLFWFGSINSY